MKKKSFRKEKREGAEGGFRIYREESTRRIQSEKQEEPRGRREFTGKRMELPSGSSSERRRKGRWRRAKEKSIEEGRNVKKTEELCFKI